MIEARQASNTWPLNDIQIFNLSFKHFYFFYIFVWLAVFPSIPIGDIIHLLMATGQVKNFYFARFKINRMNKYFDC